MKNQVFVLLILLIFSCQNPNIKVDQIMLTKIEEFKKKEKFQSDMSIFYPGISNEKLKPIVTDKINLAANDFEKILKSGNATNDEFQNAIKTGLNRFSDIYLELDTENRERVCGYFEELMDIVGLESSEGQLNNFMYDFDPNKK